VWQSNSVYSNSLSPVSTLKIKLSGINHLSAKNMLLSRRERSRKYFVFFTFGYIRNKWIYSFFSFAKRLFPVVGLSAKTAFIDRSTPHLFDCQISQFYLPQNFIADISRSDIGLSVEYISNKPGHVSLAISSFQFDQILDFLKWFAKAKTLKIGKIFSFWSKSRR